MDKITVMLTRTLSLTAVAGVLAFMGSARAPIFAQQTTRTTPAVRSTVLRAYEPVTAGRLKDPEPSNWLAIRRTYDGWGYSPLNEITTANVVRLRKVWS